MFPITTVKKVRKVTYIYDIVSREMPFFKAKRSTSINLRYERITLKYWHAFTGKTCVSKKKVKFLRFISTNVPPVL